MSERPSHCPDCNHDFAVEYRAPHPEAIDHPLAIECPECRSRITIALPADTLVYLAKRNGHPAKREDVRPVLQARRFS
jgi:hypothetical protein